MPNVSVLKQKPIREIKRSVTLALLSSMKTDCPAAFCIIYRGLIVHVGQPARRALQ